VAFCLLLIYIVFFFFFFFFFFFSFANLHSNVIIVKQNYVYKDICNWKKIFSNSKEMWTSYR